MIEFIAPTTQGIVQSRIGNSWKHALEREFLSKAVIALHILRDSHMSQHYFIT